MTEQTAESHSCSLVHKVCSSHLHFLQC
uniref:Uncharacterized protein n=1 Tax=Rhizophora mucronata TaxID=61149 RepID=A0A2P2PX67_RHIMU